MSVSVIDYENETVYRIFRSPEFLHSIVQIEYTIDASDWYMTERRYQCLPLLLVLVLVSYILRLAHPSAQSVSH